MGASSPNRLARNFRRDSVSRSPGAYNHLRVEYRSDQQVIRGRIGRDVLDAETDIEAATLRPACVMHVPGAFVDAAVGNLGNVQSRIPSGKRLMPLA